jgi:hypothetical protein
MKRLYLLATLSVLTGCATFSTSQSDEKTLPSGEREVVTTKVRATSFFAAQSSLAGWKASQSAKTQGASIAGLVVDSNAGTNVAAIAAAITKAAVDAAVKAAAP